MNNREIAARLAGADPLTLMQFVDTPEGVVILNAAGQKFTYTNAQLVGADLGVGPATNQVAGAAIEAKPVDRSSEPEKAKRRTRTR